MLCADSVVHPSSMASLHYGTFTTFFINVYISYMLINYVYYNSFVYCVISYCVYGTVSFTVTFIMILSYLIVCLYGIF